MSNKNGLGKLYDRLTAEELTTLTYMDLSSRVERLRLVEAFGFIIGAFAELATLEGGTPTPALTP